MREWLLHGVAQVVEDGVLGSEADEAEAGVLDFEGGIDGDGYDECEEDRVEPVAVGVGEAEAGEECAAA